MRTVLVVGATGILAPLADRLRERGDEVLAVSRSGADGSVAVDGHDARAVDAALGDRTWQDAAVYDPAVSEASLHGIRNRTPGRVVLVRTSRSAAEPLPTVGALQLGWTASTPHRWHTPEEVSAEALAVLDDGRSRRLGVTEPVEDRP